jgi:hypothetical protein
MTFTEEASIKILAGLLSNPSVIQRVDEAGNWSLAGDTKNLLILVVHIAKALKVLIDINSVENNYNTTLCEVCGKDIASHSSPRDCLETKTIW